MNIKLFKLCCKSLGRRKRQILRACAATFLAVFFITGVLLFEENMYEWQSACNKERFGDWFIMEVTRGGKPVGEEIHPYIDGVYKASSEVLLYDDSFYDIKGHLGYMEEDFIKNGHIVVENGRMPQNGTEIAMDYNTLLNMGYGFELNQTITINYYKGSLKDENRARKEYKLVGVLKNYTNSWVNGENMPGAIVTKEEAESYNEAGEDIYIYSIKDYVKTDNYRTIFDNLKKDSKANLYYNESVYDYKPWGEPLIYNYMYILVMVIGIIILTYQIVVYNNSRRESKQRLAKMGASKSQIKRITFAENILIVVPCGILGIAAALAAGKAVCMIIENRMGIAFYKFNYEVILKSMFSILIAGIVVLITNLFGRLFYGKQKSKKSTAQVSFKTPKRQLNSKNVNTVIHKRLLKGNKATINISIRAFAGVMCAVMAVCIYSVASANKAYEENNALPDFVGYKQEKDDYAYKYTYFVNDWVNKTFNMKKSRLDLLIESDKSDMDSQREEYVSMFKRLCAGEGDESANISVMTWTNTSGNYCKKANSNIVNGIDESFLSNIENLPGVSEVKLSAFETERMWRWEGMSFEKMGMDRIGSAGSGISSSQYKNRYLFATEYVEPTEELYKRLSKYMDKEYIDYDAFARGEQILIILGDNPYGSYDDTIKAGTSINYQYYDLPFYMVNNIDERFCLSATYYSKFLEAYKKKLYETSKDYKQHYDRNVSECNKSPFYIVGLYSEDNPTITEDWYEFSFMPCVSPRVAGVVRLSDDIREEFKDLLVDYGYYTAIASAQLGKNACKRQEELMAKFLGSYMTDDIRCEFKYNQLNVNYDISSAFSATGNIVEAYCSQANFNYASFEGEKTVMRDKTINAVLQYGITLLAAMVINILVYIIVINNRIDGRQDKFRQYAMIGMDRKKLCGICMLEAVRECMWCAFTLPFTFAAAYIIYSLRLKKLYDI